MDPNAEGGPPKVEIAEVDIELAPAPAAPPPVPEPAAPAPPKKDIDVSHVDDDLKVCPVLPG